MTGASRGIGEAIARSLTEAGARVVAVSKEPPPSREGEARYACDLGDEQARGDLLRAIHAQVGEIDVLVNNAGISARTPVLGFSLAEYARILEVNLHAPIALMTELAPQMVKRGWGRIVNISSIHGRLGEVGSLAYDVSKAGLDQATRTLAIELGRTGVLANALAPGFVETDMSIVDGANELEAPLFRDFYAAHGRLPLGRAAQPAEIAACAAWLASPANTYMTGQVITVDGGLSATF